MFKFKFADERIVTKCKMYRFNTFAKTQFVQPCILYRK